MKAVLLTAAVILSVTSMESAAQTKPYRLGDQLTAAQRRADPMLDRYPGLTPREFGTRNNLTAAEQLRQGQPAPKSVCRTVWIGNTFTTVCY